MLRIALTGGIASGKSTVANLFRELGVPVVDTDEIARDVVRPGSRGLAALTAKFGAGILDDSGDLQRERLREIIFSDTQAREKVNSILHPMILAEAERRLSSIDAPYAIIEIPLLTEAKLADQFDRVLVVDVPEAVQIERLIKRDHVDAEQARAALAAQAPRQERLRLATEVVENVAGIDTLRSNVATLHERYLDDAKRFASPASRPSE